MGLVFYRAGDTKFCFSRLSHGYPTCQVTPLEKAKSCSEIRELSMVNP